jgi:hypothetical protein
VDDIYSLLMANEPDAAQKAAQMAAALRGTQQASALNRGLSMVSGLGQNNLLAGLGQSSARAADQLAQQAQAGQQQLAAAGQMRAGHAQQRDMQRGQQLWQQKESQYQREFTGGQNRLDRDATRSNLELELGLKERLAKEKAEADAKKAGLDSEESLRKEINALPEVKQFKEAAVAYDKLESAYGLAKTNKQGAADLAMVYAYMKLIDPGVAVQEGDVGRARQGDSSAMSQARALYTQIFDGGVLSDTARDNLMRAAAGQLAPMRARYEGAVDRYRGLAGGAGANPNNVALSPGVTMGKDGKAYRVVNGQYEPME